MAGATIIGSPSSTIPTRVKAPIIELKERWSDDWKHYQELHLVQCTAASAGHDLGTLDFAVRYGAVKQAYETGFRTIASRSLANWWVRLRMLGDQIQPQAERRQRQGDEEHQNVVWVGRISGEGRQLHGTRYRDDPENPGEQTETPSGMQMYRAFDPLQMLRKNAVSTSVWLVEDADGTPVERQIGWVPAMNLRDPRGRLRGNRSATQSNGRYLYGGTELWTRKQYLEYLLVNWMNIGGDESPTWRLGGQVALLDQVRDLIPFATTQTVAEVLAKLIAPRLGVDFKIVPTADGFEIYVFALLAEEISFGGVTLPHNPNTQLLKAGDNIEMVSNHVDFNYDQYYKRVNLIGNRIVVCCTLRADDGTLVPKWTAQLESDYASGPPGMSDLYALDHQRILDQYRGVYESFGVKDNWDFQDGKAAPVTDLEGKVLPWALRDTAGIVADYQQTVRSTLPHLPLLEGVKYNTWPPVDKNPAGHEPGFLPPAAWILDPELNWYLPVDAAGMTLSVQADLLGIFVHAGKINHELGLNHFTPTIGTTIPPKYDYMTLVTTLAFELDQRIVLGLEAPEAPDELPVPVGTLDIPVPMELWYLAPLTVVGVDEYGARQTSGSTARVLRNDADPEAEPGGADTHTVALLAAGAHARYLRPRAHAEVVLKGFWPITGLIGQILSVIQDAGDTQNVQSPITSVTWIGGPDPQTIVRTGFAQ